MHRSLKPNQQPAPLLVPLVIACGFVFVPSSAAAQETSDRILDQRNAASLNSAAESSYQFPSLKRSETDDNEQGRQEGSIGGDRVAGSLITVGSSLAVVLGLFVGLIWLTRRFGGRAGNGGAIPSDVLQPLGSTALDSRTRLTMFRCGNRIVVIAQGPSGVQPVTEITAPDEVRALTAACLGNSKKAFAATLKSIEQERTAPGFVGHAAAQPSPRSRGRLFANA